MQRKYLRKQKSNSSFQTANKQRNRRERKKMLRSSLSQEYSDFIIVLYRIDNYNKMGQENDKIEF